MDMLCAGVARQVRERMLVGTYGILQTVMSSTDVREEFDRRLRVLYAPRDIPSLQLTLHVAYMPHQQNVPPSASH